MARDRVDGSDDLPYKSLNLLIISGEKAPLLTATFNNPAPYGQTTVGMAWFGKNRINKSVIENACQSRNRISAND